MEDGPLPRPLRLRLVTEAGAVGAGFMEEMGLEVRPEQWVGSG